MEPLGSASLRDRGASCSHIMSGTSLAGFPIALPSRVSGAQGFVRSSFLPQTGACCPDQCASRHEATIELSRGEGPTRPVWVLGCTEGCTVLPTVHYVPSTGQTVEFEASATLDLAPTLGQVAEPETPAGAVLKLNFQTVVP
jgi:hypothetical protein